MLFNIHLNSTLSWHDFHLDKKGNIQFVFVKVTESKKVSYIWENKSMKIEVNLYKLEPINVGKANRD